MGRTAISQQVYPLHPATPSLRNVEHRGDRSTFLSASGPLKSSFPVRIEHSWQPRRPGSIPQAKLTSASVPWAPELPATCQVWTVGDPGAERPASDPRGFLRVIGDPRGPIRYLSLSGRHGTCLPVLWARTTKRSERGKGPR